MRNPASDEAEMAERRELLPETGFRLFARHTIESVKLKEIAAEQMRPCNEAVNVFAGKFHGLCLRAENDGTLNIRMPERLLIFGGRESIYPQNRYGTCL